MGLDDYCNQGDTRKIEENEMLNQIENECLRECNECATAVIAAPMLVALWPNNFQNLPKDKTMKRETLKYIRALSLAPVTALYLVSAAAQAPTAPSAVPSASMSQGHMQKGTGGADSMKQSMMMGMDSMQKMQASGDIDKDFAMMMKMHHQQAVDMAQTELANGKSPEMKAMAKQIIAAQKKEIARFDRWLAKQK